jgi:hypothetical protein
VNLEQSAVVATAVVAMVMLATVPAVVVLITVVMTPTIITVPKLEDLRDPHASSSIPRRTEAAFQLTKSAQPPPRSTRRSI